MQAQSSSSRVVATPNPQEMGVVVSVPSGLIPADQKIEKNTPYSDTPQWCDKSLIASGYGPWIYTWSESGGDDTINFFFYKPKTLEQALVPFLTTNETKEATWFPVLEWIDFGQESGMPVSQTGINSSGQQAVFQAPRWVVRYGYRPGLSREMTQVVIRRFLSTEPFPDFATQSDEPKPSDVSWDLIGSHGNMGEVLHDDILVPAPGSGGGYRSVTSVGDVQSSSSTIGTAQFFPKTNHKTWRDYVIRDVQYIKGQYLMTETLYKAPLKRPITRLISQ